MNHERLTDAQRAFITGLEKLTRETGIAIDGCGCCDSPKMLDLTSEELSPEAGYGCNGSGGEIYWRCYDPEMPHRWEDDQKLIVKGG